jgi:hypothetical protein
MMRLFTEVAGVRGVRFSGEGRKSFGLFVALVFALCVFGGGPEEGVAQTAGAASDQGSQQAVAVRDGKNDFDFNLGVWHTHIRRVLDPFSGSDKSMELDGTVTVGRSGTAAGNWRRLKPTGRRVIGKV